MAYSAKTTAVKAAVPATVIIAGAELLKAGANAAGLEISGEASLVIMTGVFSFFWGFRNWIKNRRKR